MNSFIVSTGRCGSTLLSSLLREHPHLVSLSEVFSTLGGKTAFPDAQVTGDEFYMMLTRPRPELRLLFDHPDRRPGEILNLGGRGEVVAPIALVTLPHLTDDSKSLLSEIRNHCRQQPLALATSHYDRLFDWLAGKFGARAWVERSGQSLLYVEKLIRGWPEARFVHLYRHGVPCAISMSKHAPMRIQMYLRDQMRERRVSLEACVRDFKLVEYEHYDPPLRRFALLWTAQIIHSTQHFAHLRTDQLMNLPYEDLLQNPRRELARLIQFLAPDCDGNQEWVERVADRVLAPEQEGSHSTDSEELTKYCETGLRLLGYK